MLKVLQARLQQYMNHEFADVQAGLRKGRGSRNQIANIIWVQKKEENSRKTFSSTSLTLLKFLIVWITINWRILQEMGLPDNLTCLLRSLFARKEARVRTKHGTTDCFKIGKGVCQGCILSPCLFNIYVEYII